MSLTIFHHDHNGEKPESFIPGILQSAIKTHKWMMNTMSTMGNFLFMVFVLPLPAYRMAKARRKVDRFYKEFMENITSYNIEYKKQILDISLQGKNELQDLIHSDPDKNSQLLNMMISMAKPIYNKMTHLSEVLNKDLYTSKTNPSSEDLQMYLKMNKHLPEEMLYDID